MGAERTFDNIALIGFMGTGKSSVGHLIAARLNFQFLDTDELIEGKAGRAIGEIFAAEGEAGFRERERAIVEELQGYRDTVIATGGGLPLFSDNLTRLQQRAFVCCLWAGADVIWGRVCHQNHRPLLQVSNPEEQIAEMLEERKATYKQANLLVNTENRNMKEVARQIILEYRRVRLCR